MIKTISIPNYSLQEELINSISHGLAAALSIAGLVLLSIKASSDGALAVTSVTIFGTTMILLYTMSCIYHGLSPRCKGKKVMRVLDHYNVFLLVFGTIIPVSLIGIGGAQGWVCFSIVAFITIIGIVASSINIDKVKVIEVICHLINGWGVLIYIKELLNNIGSIGLLFIILGGSNVFIRSYFLWTRIKEKICTFYISLFLYFWDSIAFFCHIFLYIINKNMILFYSKINKKVL